MKFVINRSKENIRNLARKLGYRPITSVEEEFNCVRLLMGAEYPRLHLFIKENKEKDVLDFSLHLDQKKPSYSGSPAHSGEYEGAVVEKEAERIRKILK